VEGLPTAALSAGPEAAGHQRRLVAGRGHPGGPRRSIRGASLL